jgi:hypothetical protein
MTIIMKWIKAYEIVVDGVYLVEDAEPREVNAYNHLCHTPLTLFSQLVMQNILEIIVELEKP